MHVGRQDCEEGVHQKVELAFLARCPLSRHTSAETTRMDLLDTIMGPMSELAKVRSRTDFKEENAQRAQRARLDQAQSACVNPQCEGGGQLLETREGDWVCSACGGVPGPSFNRTAEWRCFQDDPNGGSKIRASAHSKRDAIESNFYTALAKAKELNSVAETDKTDKTNQVNRTNPLKRGRANLCISANIPPERAHSPLSPLVSPKA